MKKLSKFGLILMAGVLLALAPVVNAADAVGKEMTGVNLNNACVPSAETNQTFYTQPDNTICTVRQTQYKFADCSSVTITVTNCNYQ
jgi:spermidine/putrescine-binding protein